MRKKVIKKTVVLAAAVLLLFFSTFLLFTIDKDRITNGKTPLFSKSCIHCDDGGSVLYYGPFYQIVIWKRLTKENGVYMTGKEAHWLVGFTKEPTVPLIKQVIKQE